AASGGFLGGISSPNTKVLSGGAVLDTQANPITISQALNAAADNGVSVTATPTNDVFLFPHTVTFTGGVGSGAAGYGALDATGKITNVVVTNPGSYIAAPTPT